MKAAIWLVCYLPTLAAEEDLYKPDVQIHNCLIIVSIIVKQLRPETERLPTMNNNWLSARVPPSATHANARGSICDS